MSFLYTIIPKNYKNDIMEASNGFFLDMCDTIDFRSMYKKIKALPVTKMVDIADNFNANLKDASDYTNTDVIMNDIELADRFFKKFIKMNKYDIYNEVRAALGRPVVSRVFDIFANRDTIYAKLEISTTIDIKNYVGRQLYRKFEEIDSNYKIKNRKKSYFKTDKRRVTYYMACTFEISDILKSVKIIDVSMVNPEINMGINVMQYDNFMVPVGLTYDEMANKFIDKYNVTFPIDINKLLDTMGIKVVRDYKLLNQGKFQLHAQIVLTNGLVQTADGLVYVEGNTILVDKDYNFCDGAYALLILHELIHFEYHNYYLTLKSQVSGEHSVTSAMLESKCKNPALAIVEKQAKEISARVLVPSHLLVCELMKKYGEYDYLYSDNKQFILNKIAFELKDFFGCSKHEIDIRIKQSGIFTDDIDLTKLDKAFITNEEKENLYNNDPKFKSMIDSHTIIFKDNRCVVNNDDYINNDRITFKAYGMPDDSMVQFTKTSNVFYNNNDSLGSIYISGKTADDFIGWLKGSALNAHIDIGKMIGAIKDLSNRSEQFKDVGQRICEIMQKKNMSLNQLSLMSNVPRKRVTAIVTNTATRIDIYDLALIGHALHLTKDDTKSLILMVVSDFNNHLRDKAIEHTIDNYYDCDIEEFEIKLNEVIKYYMMLQEAGEKAQKELK